MDLFKTITVLITFFNEFLVKCIGFFVLQMNFTGPIRPTFSFEKPCQLVDQDEEDDEGIDAFC